MHVAVDFFSIFTDISAKIDVISPIYQGYIGDNPTTEIMRTRGRLRFRLTFSKPPMATYEFDDHN